MKNFLSKIKSGFTGLLVCFFTIVITGTTCGQTNLYSETFNSGGSTSWTLNGTDISSDPANQNYWVINNIYAGAPPLVINTPNEPAAITGFPQSYYMHITNGSFSFNTNFLAPATGNVLTEMNTAIVTTGYNTVIIKFWYLCKGGNAHYTGALYYSINGGVSWIQKATYGGVGAWTQATVTDPLFDNQADLRFAFQWVQTGMGSATAADPPWAVDEINVTGINDGGCPITINSEIFTNPTCHGSNDGTITITATGAGLTYTINNGSPQSNSTGAFAGLAPGTYTISVTNGSCTVNGANITITDPPIVPAPTASNNGPLCSGQTLNLMATTVAGATYSWTGPNTFSVQNPGVLNAQTSDAGTYTVVATAGGCQSAGAATTVVINQTPAAPIASNNGPLCSGQTLNLMATTVAGATYSWTGPNNFSVQNPSVPNAQTSDAGTYTVVATVNGCASSGATTTVVINQTPAAPTASNNGPLCSGQTLNLMATTVAGATYSWTGPNNFSVQNPSVPNAQTSDTGTYMVVATVGGCQSAGATTTVVINQTPASPIATSNSPICDGQTLNLMASNISGASYTWTGPNNFNTQNPSIAITTLADSGTYTLVVTVSGCNSTSVTVNVIIAPPPSTPVASSNSPLCEGQTLNLMASTINGASYSWTGPNNFSTQNPSITLVALSDSGIYTVIATIGSCNSSPATVNVVVNPSPASPTISSNSPVCGGDSLNFIAGSIGGAGYNWSGPNNFNIQNPGIAPVSLSDSGTYSLVVTVAGCSSIPVSVNVIVNPAPTVGALVASDTLICANDSAQICATAGFSSYLWNTGETANCIETSLAGNYYVTVSDANDCTVSSNHQSIAVLPVPSVSITSNGDTLSSYNEVSYQWFFNDSIIAGADAQTYIATQTGNYSVFVTDSNACIAMSSIVTITITGTEELQWGNSFEIYPNPANGSFDLAYTGTGAKNLQMILYNFIGSKIAERNFTVNHGKTISVNTEEFAVGIYFLYLRMNAQLFTKKIIIQ